MTCTVAQDSAVVDPAPSTRITAGPFVSGSQVTVRMSGILPNCKYLLQFVVGTINGNTLSLFSHMPGESIF